MKSSKLFIPWNKGKTGLYSPSPETRKKLSDYNKNIGKRPPSNLGKKLSEDTKRKISIANYKGGNPSASQKIRSSFEYKLWRKAVFERDGYTCVLCHIKNTKGLGKTVRLNADQIKPFSRYPELIFAIDNGRTLCVPCHKTTDTFAGKINTKTHD